VTDPKDLLDSSSAAVNVSLGPLPIFGIAFSVAFVLLLCMVLALAIRNRGRRHRSQIDAVPSDEDGAADPSSSVFSPMADVVPEEEEAFTKAHADEGRRGEEEGEVGTGDVEMQGLEKYRDVPADRPSPQAATTEASP
jgi:hypothetical protein